MQRYISNWLAQSPYCRLRNRSLKALCAVEQEWHSHRNAQPDHLVKGDCYHPYAGVKWPETTWPTANRKPTS